MITFENLNLSPAIVQALKAKGYTHPTAVQQQAIPHILEGKDIFGSAETGTGKTAAFALPLLQLMSSKQSTNHQVKTLVLAPTRELAIQIGDSFREYGRNLGLKHAVIYGGVSQHTQTSAIKRGLDIIVATPGRLLDLMEQGFVKLNAVEYLVLDEADRMLDMGFIIDIKKIVAKIPATRQTLFFSATVPFEIKKLASSMLKNPVTVEVKPNAGKKVDVKESIYMVDKSHKKDLLCHLIKEENIEHALVFTRTKRGADKLVKALLASGIRAQAIHGDKSQSSRQKALTDFKTKRVSFLVATDVASRGIDVKELPYVINYDLPEQAETYTHRIGRTARAGASGIALNFCSHDERPYLKDIQRYTGKNIDVIQHPFANLAPKPREPRDANDRGFSNRRESAPHRRSESSPRRESSHRSEPSPRSSEHSRPRESSFTRREPSAPNKGSFAPAQNRPARREDGKPRPRTVHHKPNTEQAEKSVKPKTSFDWKELMGDE